ncbi:MAG TPA: hypothetical protein VET87_25475, partial [Rubrivivax sp.]|nr:hypothetical protein [Rubrivivax sp.]
TVFGQALNTARPATSSTLQTMIGHGVVLPIRQRIAISPIRRPLHHPDDETFGATVSTSVQSSTATPNIE